MKKFLPILFALVAVASVTLAQSTVPFSTPGVHVLRNGGTNSVPASGTDTFADWGTYFLCEDWTNCAVTVSVRTATPYTGGTVRLEIYDVFKDTTGNFTFGQTPSYTLTVPLNSTNLQMGMGGTYLMGNYFKAALVNTNGVALTNVTVKVFFKMLKHLDLPEAAPF